MKILLYCVNMKQLRIHLYKNFVKKIKLLGIIKKFFLIIIVIVLTERKRKRFAYILYVPIAFRGW